MLWQVKDILLQDLPEGGYHNYIGRPGLQLFKSARLTQFCGLQDWHSGGDCRLLHRRLLKRMASSGGTVRLRDHSNDLNVRRVKQRLERWYSEIGRAHEHNADHCCSLLPNR